MNDFLQSLRGGQKDKRPQKTRRNFDNGHNYNSSSHYHNQGANPSARNGNFKRSSRQAPRVAEEGSPMLSTEVADNITGLIKALNKTQENVAASQERRIMVEERKADALEEIAEYLRYIAYPSLQDDPQNFIDEKVQDMESDTFEDSTYKSEDSTYKFGSERVLAQKNAPFIEPNGQSVGFVGQEKSRERFDDKESFPVKYSGSGRPRKMPLEDDSVQETRAAGSRRSREMPLFDDDVQVKRATGPGRPRKMPLVDGDVQVKKATGPGRPRKMPLVNDDVQVKRAVGPGRPRKMPLMDGEGQAKKTGPGRPRKIALVDDERPVKRTAGPGRPRKEPVPVKVLKRTRAQKEENNRIASIVGGDDAVIQEGPLARDEVMATIEQMRKDGATFDQVAKHFMEIGQPTFSGRGDWHAQTVHRLCNRH